jgi:hypothetical protein
VVDDPRTYKERGWETKREERTKGPAVDFHPYLGESDVESSRSSDADNDWDTWLGIGGVVEYIDYKD